MLHLTVGGRVPERLTQTTPPICPCFDLTLRATFLIGFQSSQRAPAGALLPVAGLMLLHMTDGNPLGATDR